MATLGQTPRPFKPRRSITDTFFDWWEAFFPRFVKFLGDLVKIVGACGILYVTAIPESTRNKVKLLVERYIDRVLVPAELASDKTDHAVTSAVDIAGIRTWVHLAKEGDQIDYLGFLCSVSRSKIRALNMHISDPKKIVPGTTFIFLPIKKLLKVTKTGRLDGIAEEENVSLQLLLEANGNRTNHAAAGEYLNVPYQIYTSTK